MTLITVYGNKKFLLMAGDTLIKNIYRKDITNPECEVFYSKANKVFAIGDIFVGFFGRKVDKFEDWLNSLKITTTKIIEDKINNNKRRFSRGKIGGEPVI